MMRTIRYYCKAFRKIAAFEPLLIPLTLVLAVATGAKPFVNIYFSARVVSELSGARSVSTLTTLVLLCLGLNFALQILTEWLMPTFSMIRSRMYEKERMEIEHKLFTLDFAKLENSDFQELVHLHSESMEKVFSAFAQLCWMLRDFVTGVSTLVCAFILLAPLVRIGFTKTGEGFVHSPGFYRASFVPRGERSHHFTFEQPNQPHLVFFVGALREAQPAVPLLPRHSFKLQFRQRSPAL